jgi:hypothetical protein
LPKAREGRINNLSTDLSGMPKAALLAGFWGSVSLG